MRARGTLGGLAGLLAVTLAGCRANVPGEAASRPPAAPPTGPRSAGVRSAGSLASKVSTSATPRSRSGAAPTAGATGPLAAAAGGCRSGNPTANVYHAYRLHVVRDCLTVTGSVAYVRREDDGDIHVMVALPRGDSSLLDQANIADEHGNLVTEIVPADQPGCLPGHPPPLPATAYTSAGYAYGTCTGADVATPPADASVRVTGPYVLDTDHGWMEIHPVWSMTVTGATAPGQAAVAPPVRQASTAAPRPWCQASAAPSHDGYRGDVEVSVHSDQPSRKATASDAGDRWSRTTDSSGFTRILLYHTSAGMTISVTVGAASCSTRA